MPVLRSTSKTPNKTLDSSPSSQLDPPPPDPQPTPAPSPALRRSGRLSLSSPLNPGSGSLCATSSKRKIGGSKAADQQDNPPPSPLSHRSGSPCTTSSRRKIGGSKAADQQDKSTIHIPSPSPLNPSSGSPCTTSIKKKNGGSKAIDQQDKSTDQIPSPSPLYPSSGSPCTMSSNSKSDSRGKPSDKSADQNRSVTRRRPVTRSGSKGVKIEGSVVIDLDSIQGEGEIPTDLARNEMEIGNRRILRSGSAIGKRKVKDDETDSGKIGDGSVSVGKRRIEQRKEAESADLGQGIRENVSLRDRYAPVMVSDEYFEGITSEMMDKLKEGVNLSPRASEKSKGKEKLVIIDEIGDDSKSDDLGEGIRENANPTDGFTPVMQNSEEISLRRSQMIDQMKERIGLSLRPGEKSKGKEKLVINDKKSDEIPQNDSHSKLKLSYEEKGKGKMVMEQNSISDSSSFSDSSSLSDSSDSDAELRAIKLPNISDMNENIRMLIAEKKEIPKFRNMDEMADFYVKMAEKKPESRREADRNRALELAPKFAFFKNEEGNETGTDEDSVPDSGTDDWPGPFSTAMKIISERKAKLEARQNNASKSDESNEVKIPWIPSRDKSKKQGCFGKTAPSLKSLCMKVLGENGDEIESLEGIPDGIKSRIVTMLCNCRKMNCRYLRQLVKDRPAEICMSDCSWLTEKEFEEIFSECDTSELKVLKLDLCGRCLPPPTLLSTLARSPSPSPSLPVLTHLSLKGAYSLSDAALSALLSSAPSLSSLNLSHCSFLTSQGIVEVLERVGEGLRELWVEECQGVAVGEIKGLLRGVRGLEVLGVGGLEVRDGWVKEVVGACGGSLRRLSFNGCTKLTAASMKVIGENCPNLVELDIRNVTRLNDSAIAHLANGCGSLQKLLLRRNSFSDEAVAAFVEASGANLIELSLNNVQKVGHHTALAIYRKCRVLQNLDLSFCRKMSDEALGLIVDTCLSLRTVKLFGCTQIKGHFLDGHSNSSVKVLGLSGNILDQFEVPDFA